MSSTLKCLLIGDGAVGKTSLLSVFATGHFPRDYEPTIEDNRTVRREVDGRAIRLVVWDTAGQEEYGALIQASLPGTQVFLICFSVDYRDSLANVSSKWVKVVRDHCPSVPVVLVATKTDLRCNGTALEDLRSRKEVPLTHREGEDMSRQVGAVKYVECSARENHGVENVFDEVVRAHFGAAGGSGRKKRKKKCSVQ